MHMRTDVVKDTLFNSPTEEIELSDGCEKRCGSANLEKDALTAAEWIK